MTTISDIEELLQWSLQAPGNLCPRPTDYDSHDEAVEMVAWYRDKHGIPRGEYAADKMLAEGIEKLLAMYRAEKEDS